MKIAVLEDDQDLARHLLDILLQSRQHHCDHYATCESFRQAVLTTNYDLLIMDWQLPDGDGVELLRTLRATLDWHIPVLFLTQREREEDIVQALEAGADDYMVKPARAKELLARLQALERRNQPNGLQREQLQFGPFELDTRKRSIHCRGEPLTLTEKDFDLALFLFRNKERLLSRAYLLEKVWDIYSDINTRTVDTHISRLRRKVGINPENGFRIRTVYQHGYRLEETSDEDE